MDAVNQLAEYSGWHVIIVLMLVLFAVEGILKAMSYFWGKVKAYIHREDTVMEAVDEHDSINKKLDDLTVKVNDISNAVDLIKEQNKKFQEQIGELQSKNDLMDKKFIAVEENEKSFQEHLQNNTRAFIIGQYHQFRQDGYIDDMSLYNLEECFKCYKKNGGNGFLDEAMSQIRKLPRTDTIGK